MKLGNTPRRRLRSKELNEHLRNAQKILIDIVNAERNKLDSKLLDGQSPRGETNIQCGGPKR